MQTEVRIRVLSRDRELRAWLVDELALLSPTIEVQTIDTLDTTGTQLLIVELDGLATADVDRLCKLTIPVIAIGAPHAQLATAPCVCMLDAGLTSKQLKRAVLDSLSGG
ncbi:MAG TPA: hypothetical protein VIV11_00330 [Kofleriaceae bacterium]